MKNFNLCEILTLYGIAAFVFCLYVGRLPFLEFNNIAGSLAPWSLVLVCGRGVPAINIVNKHTNKQN